MYCEMCGSDQELFKCHIEGTFLNVCRKCSEFGKTIQKIKDYTLKTKKILTKPPPIERNEVIQIITPNYSTQVKNKREAIDLKQKELAQKIGEKESVIHKIESGAFKPGLELARKLEKFLNIKLVEQYEEKKDFKFKSADSSFMTLSDLMKTKKN